MGKTINDKVPQSLNENQKDSAREAIESVFGFGCTIGEVVNELRGLYVDFVTAWMDLAEEENAPCSPSVANDHLYFLNCIIQRLEQLEESNDQKVTARVEETRAERENQPEASAAIDSLKENARILLEMARSEREAMEQTNRTA